MVIFNLFDGHFCKMYLEQQQYLKMIALEYIGCVKYAHLHLFQKLKVLLHLSTTKLSVATIILLAVHL